MGVTPSKEAAARAACRRDLEQVALGLEQIPDSTVREILLTAGAAVPSLDITIDLPSITDVIVTASIANPLRDAIVEALRNVERHSGEHRAILRARVNDIIRVEVIDKGIGVSADAEERFGLRNTIRSGMASIDGSARIHAPATGGTVVALTAPLVRPRKAPALGLRTVRIVDSSLWARLGVLGTNAFMLLVLTTVVGAFERPGLVAGLTIAYAAVLAVLALRWQHVPRIPLTVLAHPRPQQRAHARDPGDRSSRRVLTRGVGPPGRVHGARPDGVDGDHRIRAGIRLRPQLGRDGVRAAARPRSEPVE